MSLGALGRTVAHDPRSRAFPAKAATTHRPVTHRTYGPVLDQGAVGSCVLTTAAHALNTRGNHRVPSRLRNQQDALEWYGPVSAADPFPGTWPEADTGTDANSAAKHLRNLGLVASWSHCFGLDHVLATLQLRPVMLGIAWHRSMYWPDAAGFVHPDGNIDGGHETLIRGDDAKGSVLVRNSWSALWGLRGHYRLTYADLDALLADSGDALVLAI